MPRVVDEVSGGSTIPWDQEGTTCALPRKVLTVPPLHDHHNYWLSAKLSGVASGPGTRETPAMYFGETRILACWTNSL